MVAEDETDHRTNRRTLLKTVGAGAAAFGLAGCTGAESEPEPTTRVPTTSTPATTTTTGAPTTTATPTTTTPEPGGGGSGTAGLGGCPVEAVGAGGTCESPEELTGTITEDRTIGADCKTYRVGSRLVVEGGATLTVEPGTKLVFGQGAYLSVLEDSALSAVGTCERPIVFTGEQATRGYWRGIKFDETDRTPSRLAYCVVEYGGSKSFGWADEAAGVTITRGARVAIEHSTVRESAAYGVYCGQARIDAFEANAVTGNADGAVWTDGASAHGLSDTSTYTGNDTDVVHVDGDHIGPDMDVTWDAIDVPYSVLAENQLEVTGHLTIAPGTTVEFGQGAWLNVVTDGAPGQLTAVGMVPETEEVRPITFTGEQQTRGYWRGILFDETDRVRSQLRYCVVEYGGSKSFGWANEAANVTLTRGARVRIDDCTIRESAAYGVYVGEGVTVDSFIRSTLTGNADGAAWLVASRAHVLSDTSTFTGNDTDVVHLNGDRVGPDMEVTWDAIDVPYSVLSGSAVKVVGHLTIDPGATVEFGQGAWLATIVDDGTSGRLTAVGIDPDTERSMPITFTGEQQTRGYWRGIAFDETNRTENQLRNCVVEYGGSKSFGWADEAANVTLTRGARVRVDSCTIREGDAYGVYFADDATVDSFTTNTVTRNRRGPARATGATAHVFSDTSTYTGNDVDQIDLVGTDVTRGQTVTWDAVDVPYNTLGGTGTVVSGRLTIDPGATLTFGQGAWLSAVDDDGTGSITAVGTSDEPITFTGEQQTRGYWRGILFDETNRTENQLAYCVVEYGGSKSFGWANDPADVAVTRGSRLSIRNSTIRHSAGYGLYAEDSAVTASATSFADNALGSRN